MANWVELDNIDADPNETRVAELAPQGSFHFVLESCLFESQDLQAIFAEIITKDKLTLKTTSFEERLTADKLREILLHNAEDLANLSPTVVFYIRKNNWNSLRPALAEAWNQLQISEPALQDSTVIVTARPAVDAARTAARLNQILGDNEGGVSHDTLVDSIVADGWVSQEIRQRLEQQAAQLEAKRG